MRKLFYIFILLLFASNSYSAISAFDIEFTNAITYTRMGFVMPYANKPMVIQDKYIYIIGHNNSDTNRLFLYKYNYIDQQIVWEKSWGYWCIVQASTLLTMSMSSDSSNIFVAGAMRSLCEFEGQTNCGIQNVYLAKIHSNNGTTEWSRIFGSTNSDEVSGIALDVNTNIFVYGTTSRWSDANKTNIIHDIFLTKYNCSGDFIWNKKWDTHQAFSRDIIIDPSTNIYLIGQTLEDMGSQTNQGTNDIFVIKTDKNGNDIWTKMMGSSSNDFSVGIVMDNYTNLIIKAYTSGNLNGQINTGNMCLAVIKMDSNGNHIWTKLYDGSGFYRYPLYYDYGGISINKSNIYVSSSLNSNGINYAATYTALSKFDNNTGSNLWNKIWPTLYSTNYSASTNFSNMGIYHDNNGNLAIASANYGGDQESRIQLLFPFYNLVISGSPCEYQTNSLPFIYGTNRIVCTIPLTNSIPYLYQTNATDRYVCDGWSGTGSITNGFTNSIIISITNNSTLTWHWQKQYWVDITNTDGCSINYINGNNGWNNEGKAMILSAVPRIYFQNWNVQPINYTTTNNPIYLSPLTKPLSIIANFNYQDNGYGMDYGWVLEHWGMSYNPTQSSSYNNNGITDYQAYLMGVDPTISNNPFSVNIALSNDLPVISWSNNVERYFTILGSSDLSSTNWGIVGETYSSGNGSYINNSTNQYSFYRVMVQVR